MARLNTENSFPSSSVKRKVAGAVMIATWAAPNVLLHRAPIGQAASFAYAEPAGKDATMTAARRSGSRIKSHSDRTSSKSATSHGVGHSTRLSSEPVPMVAICWTKSGMDRLMGILVPRLVHTRRALTAIARSANRLSPTSVTQVSCGTDLSASSTRAPQISGSSNNTAAAYCAPIFSVSKDCPVQASAGSRCPTRLAIHCKTFCWAVAKGSFSLPALTLMEIWLIGTTDEYCCCISACTGRN